MCTPGIAYASAISSSPFAARVDQDHAVAARGLHVVRLLDTAVVAAVTDDDLTRQVGAVHTPETERVVL